MQFRYLHVDILTDRLGDAFDDIRRNDDRLGWVGFTGKLLGVGGCFGINPMKAIDRIYLETYVGNVLKNHYHNGNRAPEWECLFFAFPSEQDGVEDYATELALRYGKGIVRRAPSFEIPTFGI